MRRWESEAKKELEGQCCSTQSIANTTESLTLKTFTLVIECAGNIKRHLSHPIVACRFHVRHL